VYRPDECDVRPFAIKALPILAQKPEQKLSDSFNLTNREIVAPIPGGSGGQVISIPTYQAAAPAESTESVLKTEDWFALRFIVEPNGRASHVESFGGSNEARSIFALRALGGFEFAPAIRDGRPVRSWAIMIQRPVAP
jgi:hypothetical protein